MKNNVELTDIKNEYMFLLKKDKELGNKITRLEPLLEDFVSEISDNNKSENTLDDGVNNLRKTLEDCIISEEKFQRAAYYDAKEHFQFERCRRPAK